MTKEETIEKIYELKAMLADEVIQNREEMLARINDIIYEVEKIGMVFNKTAKCPSCGQIGIYEMRYHKEGNWNTFAGYKQLCPMCQENSERGLQY